MDNRYYKLLANLCFFIPILVIVFINILQKYYIEIEYFNIILIIIFGLFIYCLSRNKSEINNPVNLFFIGWIIPLLLSQIRLSYLQKDYLSTTWKLIIFTSIAFILPIIINSSSKKVCFKNKIYKVNKLYKPIKYLYLLSISFILMNWILQGGIPLISGEYVVGHLDYIKGFTYFTNINIVLSGISVLYLIISEKKNIIIIFSIFTPYIFSILQATRSIMFGAIYYQLCFLYIALRIKGISGYDLLEKVSKKVITLLIIFILLMSVVGNIRIDNYNEETNNNSWSKTLFFKKESNILAWLYSYYPMNFDNLNEFILNFDNNYSDGYNVLMPIIGPTQIKSLMNEKKISYKTLWPTATGTYLMKIYGDGGLIFSIIVTFLLGLIISIIYKNYIKYNNIQYYGVYVILSFGILYMFFDSGAFFDPTVIIYSYMVYKLLKNVEIDFIKEEENYE